MTRLETDVLTELMQGKRHCLVHLRALAEKQLALVRGGSMTDLLGVLGAKQQVLNQLQRIERDLDQFRHQDPESRRWRTAQDREQCAAELAACESLLADIVRQERQSEQELTRRRDEAAAQLQEAGTAGHARRAYLTPAVAGPSQLDLASG